MLFFKQQYHQSYNSDFLFYIFFLVFINIYFPLNLKNIVSQILCKLFQYQSYIHSTYLTIIQFQGFNKGFINKVCRQNVLLNRTKKVPPSPSLLSLQIAQKERGKVLNAIF